MGVKFTNEMIMDFNLIGNFKNRKYNMLMGRDEILTSALVTGVTDGAVSSTINFMTYNLDLENLFVKFDQTDLDKANALQLKTT